MKSVAVSEGVRVSAPDWAVVEPLTATRGAGDPVLQALDDPDVTVAGSATVAAAPPTRGLPATTRATAPSEVAVEVAPGERAVLLVERDGVYEWVMPEAERRRAPTRGRPEGRELVFRVAPSARADAPARSRSIVSMASSVVHVLKFPGHLVGDLAIRYLERNVKPGMVQITGSTLAKWRTPKRAPSLPKDRSPRVLLFVHGTFSSTVGGFAGLTHIPDGRQLLDRAVATYDAILGWDHRTLSVDPFDNAQEYLDMLEGLKSAHPLRIDAIAHSRGGLTLRSLIEHLLPERPEVGVVERGLLVACTNGGTQLARPANWKALLDIYTNLAVAGATFTGATAAPILAGVLKGVSALAKYLSNSFLGDEEAIPGLAAMNPDGRFVATINGVQPGEPTPEGIVYDILTSDYEPPSRPSDAVTARVKKALQDAAIDRLMKGVENDGVVDVGGMRHIGPPDGGFVDDELHFTPPEAVTHCTYFRNPQAARRMAGWLGLLEDPAPAPAPAPPATPKRGRAAAPANGAATGPAAKRPRARPKKAKWTVMVFQAAVNSLDDFAVKDLQEMQGAELDPSVRLAVFQARNDVPAFQTIVGGHGRVDERVELDEVDSGNPKSVLRFVKWAVERAPAERYGLVLWSHGSGWEPDDLEQLYTSATGRAPARGALRGGAPARRTLFPTNAVEVLQRAILVDDGTGHSLDTIELGSLARAIHRVIGAPLELLGMDACLMNCVEVAYQLRRDVRAIVGSQEEEPGDGWPYTNVLDDLSAKPTMNGIAWGKAIASRYADSYRNGEQVTQSVLDLSKLPSLTRPLNALGKAIVAVCGESNQRATQVRMAVMDALSFPNNDGTQVDLGQLCAQLKAQGLGDDLDAACDAVVKALAPGGVVAARQNRGSSLSRASGVSIYFPEGPSRVTAEYPHLAFARSGSWKEALAAVHPTAFDGG